MTIDDLIRQFRQESSDDTAPFRWGASLLLRLFNEAVEAACVRKPLLFDATTTTICEIAVASGTATYAMHGSIVNVTAAYLVDTGGAYIYLKVKDRLELDRINPTWREQTGEPAALIVDAGFVTLDSVPDAAYTLHLEVNRIPLATEQMLLSQTPADSPVIDSVHHRYLCHYVLAAVYTDDDISDFAHSKADRHRKMFDRYFGAEVNADLGRKGFENRPHVNKLW